MTQANDAVEILPVEGTPADVELTMNASKKYSKVNNRCEN